MIHEKHKRTLSIISIILAVIFVIYAYFIRLTNAKATGNISSNTLNKDAITEIDIKIDDSDWDWLIQNASKEEYRKADVTINGETFYSVGIRPKGNSSLNMVSNSTSKERYSLKIDFSEYVKGQTYHGIEKLALNNMMSDTTYMKEYLSYDLLNTLGVPTPEFAYSNIRINDKNWGLFLEVEVIDKNFVEKHYGSVLGNLYKPESMEIGGGNGNMNFNRGEIQNGNGFSRQQGNNSNNAPNANVGGQRQQGMGGFGNRSSGGANLKYTDDNQSSYSVVRDGAVFKSTTDEDFEKVITMIKNLNTGTELEKYLNVEEILKYFAVNTFLVNLDSYSGGMYHNYYLYEQNGKFAILPWDFNMSFAGFSMNSASNAINFPIDNPVTGSLENAPLIGKLLEVKEYKDLYHSYLQKITDEYMGNGKFEAKVNKLDKLINNYVKSDSTAFYGYESYKNSLPQLITFAKDRVTSITEQLSGRQSATGYGNVKTTLDLSKLGSSMGGGMGNFNRGQGNNKNNQQNVNNNSNGNKNSSAGNFPNDEGLPDKGQFPDSADMPNYGEMPGGEKPNFDQMPPGQDGNKGQDGIPAMNNNMAVAGNNNTSSIKQNSSLMQLAVLAAILLGGLIFVFKFNRRSGFIK